MSLLTAAWVDQCLRQAQERMRARLYVAAAVWVGEAMAAARSLPDEPAMIACNVCLPLPSNAVVGRRGGQVLCSKCDGLGRVVNPEREIKVNLIRDVGKVERELLALSDRCPHCERLVRS